MTKNSKRAPASAGSDTDEVPGLIHDLNNVLMVLRGSLDLANDSTSEAERQRALGLGLECLPRVRRLLDATAEVLGGLSTSSPSAGGVSTGQVVAETLRTFEAGLPPEIRLYGCARVGLWPVALPLVEFERVLGNLLKNAAEAMPKGGGIITVTADNVTVEPGANPPVAPGRYVLLAVRDAGTGIPPEIAARLFEPFATSKPDGTGLGLATVKRLVEANGGGIAVESFAGKGTRFTLWLPAAR